MNHATKATAPGKGPVRWRANVLADVARAALLAVAAGMPITGAGQQPANSAAAEGLALYMAECSKCHGVMDASAKVEPGDARIGVMRVALRAQVAGERLAFALPFGPPLAGVYGRRAGSIADFEYSKAFMTALDGVTWGADSLDAYLEDSQARAPGARMFYRQPDPELRRRIIAFLKSRS